MKQIISPEALVASFYQELEARGYRRKTYYTYRAICNRLMDWCRDMGITKYSPDVGERFCDANIGGHQRTGNMSVREKYYLRTIRLLNNLQSGGDFEYRTPLTSRSFREDYLSLVESFTLYLSEEMHLSPYSIRAKRSILLSFDIYQRDHGRGLTDISVVIVEAFMSDCCPQKSRHIYKVALHSFFEYLKYIGATNEDLSRCILKEPRVAKQKALVSTYSEDEVRTILSSVSRYSSKGKRDYLVVLLAAEYGLRASDIVRLNLAQIDWEKNLITIVQHKTKVQLSLPLLPSVGNAIIDYLKSDHVLNSQNYIIVRHDTLNAGKPISAAMVTTIVAKAIEKANPLGWKQKRHGPHALRHSLATNMLQKNTPLPLISSVLGHSTLETTKVYLSVDIEHLRKCCLPMPLMQSQHYRTIYIEDHENARIQISV